MFIDTLVGVDSSNFDTERWPADAAKVRVIIFSYNDQCLELLQLKGVF